MTTLVAYATRHGSTREVAARIAARLEVAGVPVEVLELHGGEEVGTYDAVVLGSAVYAGAWLPPAVEFARRNVAVLRPLPVWTFTVGRLVGQRGLLSRVRWPDAGEPTEGGLGFTAREHRFFAGVMDRAGLPGFQRLVFRTVGGRYGDFRDPAEIDAWADHIAGSLTGVPHLQGE